MGCGNTQHPHLLQESNRQLQSLSASLQNYREEERTRIARELHDSLAQVLSFLQIQLTLLKHNLNKNDATAKQTQLTHQRVFIANVDQCLL